MEDGRSGVQSIFSSPQPHYPYEKTSSSSSSLVVAADFHMKLPKVVGKDMVCDHASGLLCFSYLSLSTDDVGKVHVICNPSTGQCTSLPKLVTHGSSKSFLGFDPIDKQFKVLVVHRYCHDHPMILTLGTEKMNWRKIQCPLYNKRLFGRHICFNGVLYFSAQDKYEVSEVMIVCFDVRSETFKFIDIGFIFNSPPIISWAIKLINYKGRLGMIGLYQHWPLQRSSVQLCVWVLEDVEKQEWAENSYTLLDNEIVDRYVCVSGVTATGEIVLSEFHTDTCKEFCVFYFNPKKNTLQTLEIQGNPQASGLCEQRVDTFVDHVEDLNFIYSRNTRTHEV